LKIKIRERSTEKLVVHCRPNKWFYVLFGMTFLVLGDGVIWTLANRISLHADSNSVEYKMQFLSLITTRAFCCPSVEVKDVWVAEGNELITGYSIQFVTEGRTHNAAFNFADMKAKQEIADSCKSAIAKPDGNFERIEHGSPIGVAVGGICICLGMLFFFLLQSVTITMDRTTQQIVLDKQRWLPFTRSVKTIDLHQVRRIVTQDCTLETDGGHATSTEVAFTLSDGRLVAISNAHMFDKKSGLELSKLLNSWRESASSP
jgi:hypothetical protein